MIIKDGSVLRRVPSALNARQRLFLDGIRYSIEIADLAYGRLHRWAEEATATMRDGKTPNRNVFRGMIADAWAMVDAVHRLRRLIENMPGAKRGPRIKGFLAVTKDVSTMRHRVQHLDEQIRGLAEKQLPAWGSVSWFYSPDASQPRGWVYALAAGSFEVKHRLLSPAGRESTLPIGLITLDAYGVSIVLSDVYGSVERFASGFERIVEDAHKELKPGGSDIILAIELGWEAVTKEAKEALP